MEPLLATVAFSVNELYLISQISSEMDNSVQEHATDMR